MVIFQSAEYNHYDEIVMIKITQPESAIFNFFSSLNDSDSTFHVFENLLLT